MKYYNRYKQSGKDLDLLPRKRGPKWKTRRPIPFIENKVRELRLKGNNRYEIVSILQPKLKQFTPSPSGVYNIIRRQGLNRLKPAMKEEKRKIIKEKVMRGKVELMINYEKINQSNTISLNKEKIIKFSGCYHGHSDSFLIEAGSGVVTFGTPNSPGVTKGTAQDTLIAPYNNLNYVKELFQKNRDEVAAIIIEPVAGNMGCVIPQNGFIEGLRKLCDQNNCLLIFDEVMTGFRLAKGGAQEVLGVNADIVTYGKVIGGGLPVGAFSSRDEIMNNLSPEGSVYQAGTLSGNPLAMSAGLATLSELKINDNIYLQLSSTLSSQELEASISIIKNVCSKFDLISGYRVKIVEMKFTHNINITFSTIIEDVKEQINGIDILDIAPTVGSMLYMEIFDQLEKSELTPDTKILFMQS